MLTAQPILQASGLSQRRFRQAVGAGNVAYQKAMQEISVHLADRWCCRLGLHPAEVYGLKTWLRALGFDRV